MYVTAATNRLEMMDPEILRPGRVGGHICMGLSNTLLRKIPVTNSELWSSELAEFAKLCDRLSRADLSDMVYKAALNTIGKGADSSKFRIFKSHRRG